MCSTQANDKLTGELSLFCPLESCSHYQKPDNTIKKDGIYRTQSDPVPRQMYYCHGGGHRFSETHYSELKHKQGSMKEYEQTGSSCSAFNFSTRSFLNFLILSTICSDCIKAILNSLTSMGYLPAEFRL